MKRDIFLGVETSGMTTGLSLVRGDQVLVESVEQSGRGHNEILLALLGVALAKADVAPRELAGIGVTIGPGMFTSLRVGLSAVKGLALVGGTPVKGIGTLPALARSARATGQAVLAVVDAKKGQVYAALYDAAGTTLVQPFLAFPDDMGRLIAAAIGPGKSLLLAGSGRGIVASGIERAGFPVEISPIENPRASVVAVEAARLIAAGSPDDLATLEPLYLRRTDAEINRERKTRAG